MTLPALLREHRSGQLTVRDPRDCSIVWRVFFGDGKIHFATSAMGLQERTSYLLQRHQLDISLPTTEEPLAAYRYWCNMWQQGHLNLQTLRKLLSLASQEALVQLSAMPPAMLQFEAGLDLDPILLSVSCGDMLSPVQTRLEQWMQLSPCISSPFQRLVARDSDRLQHSLQQQIRNSHVVQQLTGAIAQKGCLYDIARTLNIDVLALAATLQPAIRSGLLDTTAYDPTTRARQLAIACIDDSRNVQAGVRGSLETVGYRVLELTTAAQAMAALTEDPPALILIDTDSPAINGYELCRVLRQLSLLKNIPFIMLTERDSMAERFKAKLVGFNDYLIKPCEAELLRQMVQDKIGVAVLPTLAARRVA
jgi:twitching motility two-component system response regulator PilG